jgi:cyanophycinase
MKGHIVLEGGAEFGGKMNAPDRRAIDLAGGADATICIIPAAAAPDHNDQRAGEHGVRWFKSLGAKNVLLLPLVDHVSANDPAIAATLLSSRLIYLLGGFTHHLGMALAGSLSLNAMVGAYQSGAVIAGSSAGAMVLCQHYFDPEAGQTRAGLNFIPNACVIPHHDQFGRRWAPRLADLLPGVLLIGIDEQTGMVDDAPDGGWSVHGKGSVTLYRQNGPQVVQPGQIFSL